MVEDFYCPKAGAKNAWGFNFSRERCIERIDQNSQVPPEDRKGCGCYDRYTGKLCKVGRKNHELSNMR